MTPLPAVVAFDTDETIYKSWDPGDGSRSMMIRWDVINIAICLKQVGAKLVLWSGGGGEYAKSVANRMGLSFLFDEFSMKSNADAERLCVDISFDDQLVDLGKVSIKV
jgi:hypothetical protein